VTNVECLSHTELVDLVTKQSSLLAKQASEIADLKAQLKWFQNQIFGRKSERRLAGDSKYVQLTLVLAPARTRI
jgi:predicted CoA-binding protein